MASELFTRVQKVWLGEDDIVRIVVFPDAELTLADAREAVAAVARASQGRRCPLLIDIRAVKSIDHQARQYFAGPEAAETALTIALLVGSPISRMIASFFLGLNRSPLVPTKVFTSEKEALEWLKGFL